MIPEIVAILLLQLPFDFNPSEVWLNAMKNVLNVLYAIAVDGYILLVLLGFMVFATGLSDGTAKHLVGFGVLLFFLGPTVTNVLAKLAGMGPLTLESATATWYGLFGVYESQLVALMVMFGEVVMAVCILVGAILYFNQTSNDLKSRGHSLMVRGVMLAPILAFMYVVPWI